jgi:hypothetical protein
MTVIQDIVTTAGDLFQKWKTETLHTPLCKSAAQLSSSSYLYHVSKEKILFNDADVSSLQNYRRAKPHARGVRYLLHAGS